MDLKTNFEQKKFAEKLSGKRVTVISSDEVMKQEGVEA